MGKEFSKKLLESVGKSYGEYKVIAPYADLCKGKNSHRYVTAECSCGKVKNIRVDSLWRGVQKVVGVNVEFLAELNFQ